MEHPTTKKELFKKTIQVVFGLFIFSLGAALTIQSDIGMAPWLTLSMGISYHVPFSFGTVHTTISLLIVVIDYFMHESIGIGTILDALLVGYFSDFIIWTGLLPTPSSIWVGVIMTMIGLFVMAIGQYYYMSAYLGCGPRDTLFIAIGKRLRKMSVGVVQTIILVAVFLVGWLLGAPAGIGTFIAVFFTGTAMQIVFQLFHFDPRDTDQFSFVQAMKLLFK